MITKRGRLPGIVNIAAAAALLVLVLSLALRVATNSPPAIAEFAPQAQQVKTAPAEQTATFGNGSGGAAGGATPSPSPSPTQPGGNGAILLQCVGDPPRQTEDPQSPPCVATWQGDNGGATSFGVTRDTINVAIPTECGSGSTDGQNYNDLEQFFNRRFELYGRHVKFWCGTSGIGESPAPQQRADADNMYAAHQPFASTHYRAADGFYYNEQMGCVHHVVTVAGAYFPFSEHYLAQCPGYLWSYVMAAEQEFTYEGEWICDRLAGRVASHSPGSDTAVPPRRFNQETRKFGIIFQPYYTEDPTRPDALRTQLKVCNVAIPDRDVEMNPISNPDAAPGVPVDPSSTNNAILQMKQDNISSVICLCNLFSFGALQKAASNQSYYPEWIASTYGPNDIAAGYELGSNPPDQRADTFGITFTPRAVQPQEDPYWMAIKSVDPTASLGTNADAVQNMEENYRPLLVLISGLQMAGPHLTQQSFADGLHRTVFPNPDTPIRAGYVGFPGGSYSMTIDGAEWWYSNNDPGPYSDSSTGTICYIDGGVRIQAGRWPSSGDPFFKEPCNGIA